MLAWAIAGSKISVQAIHNIITSLLHFNSEMAYFHFTSLCSSLTSL